MPALEVSDLTQQAVLWAMSNYDSFGQPAVGDPIQINVRWVWHHREVVDAKGNTISLAADVAAAQDIPINSHMWLGTLDQWNSNGMSQVNQDLYEVKTSDNVPDVKGRNVRRTFGLMKLHDSGAN